MRLPALILFSLAVATSCSVEHEQAAKKFYGSLIQKFQQGKHAELFDLLYAKWEHFYPGLVTKEQAGEIRAAFIDLRERQANTTGHNKPTISVPLLLSASRTLDGIKDEIKRRCGIFYLNSEGRTFMKLALASFPKDAGTSQLRPLSKDFDAFRATFDVLAESTKKKLAKQFAIFGKLDEVKALVTVFDRLLGALQTMCENLPGFAECDHIKIRKE